MKQSKINRRYFFDRMSGLHFEHYCAKLLQRNGYKKVTVTSASMDQGIDIIAYKHHTSYGIQCKKYSGKIGNKAVQEVYAGCCYYDLDVPVVMTNSFFTSSAKQLAERTDVILWDRITLLSLKKHSLLTGFFSGLFLSLLVILGLFLIIYYTRTLFFS